MRELEKQPITPTLAETILVVLDSELVKINTSMPGNIVKYDPATQTADIQPSLKREYYDGSAVDLPVLPGVPIVFPRTATSFIHLPLQAGDPVVVIFSQRSLDNWKTTGGTAEPADARKFDLSDAIAIPGGEAPNKPFTVSDPTAITIKNDSGEFVILPAGKFKIKNASDELIDVLSQVTEKVGTISDTLSKDTVNTIFGPMPLNSFTQYATLKTELDSLKAKLDGLKG